MTDPDQVQAAIAQTVEHIHGTLQLVHDLGEPELTESLVDLHRRLLVTRSVMTRVSELVGQLLRVQAMARKALIDAQDALETANAATVEKTTFGHAAFASGDERKAKLAAATIEERRRVRQSEKLMIDIDSAVEYGRTRHRELDRAVRDVETRMKLITWEPNAQ